MALSKTPSKPRAKKRVRFSDPGPELDHFDSSSTGLTPMVRRSSLGTTPSPKRRRHSTPARARHDDDEDELAGDGSSFQATEIHFVSLRQVLDDRVKRRIRRNGLSEEMHIINDEKRRRAQKDKEELQRLREELAEKDDEIERLRDTTMIQDTDRIFELEQQVEELRDQLSNKSATADQSQNFEWTLAARDPFSDSYLDDEGFGDATMAELVCSTPSRARASFPTPPCTSPALPATPCSMRRSKPVTPTSHAGVQASFPDPEKEALEAELGSLHLELSKLTDALEAHETLKSRVADKLNPQGTETEGGADIEAQLDTVLQNLSDRTAALLDLNASLSSLGFAGNDASEIVASLAAAFRSARLELEYLTPGEITLPLSSHGAEVLDLVLGRLRDLAKKVREDEDAIDEYHELELSLRRQLGARVEAMNGMSRELKSNAANLLEKDEKISELEVGVDRLKGAVEGYRRDIVELETLVQRMESSDNNAAAQLQTEVDAGKQEISRRDESIVELETKLSSVLSQTAELRIQLADIQARKVAEVAALNKSHGGSLALRDARVSELRIEIASINKELRSAHETIQQLRVENATLQGGIDSERRKAKDAIDSMKAELERVLKMSDGILATPKKTGRRRSSAEKTPDTAMQPGEFLSGDQARTSKGKKRRRYDSGLGFLDEEELDV